jgi:carboxypeptidase Taq
VILRYEIERALFEHKITVADIPDVWDQRMQDLLGLSTSGNFKDGCMQDVHWPAGLFGYFPSYTLGALTAAQLFAAASEQMPGMQDEIACGNFGSLNDWLRTNVWSKASLYSGEEILKAATGSPLSTAAFKAHVQRRYLES